MDYSASREKLVAVATAMLAHEMPLLEGVRSICSLRFEVGDPDNEFFLPIRAVDSETDHFPVGEERGHWSEDALARSDAELAAYLADMEGTILKACMDIVTVFGISVDPHLGSRLH